MSLLGDLDAELARAPLGAAVQPIRAALQQLIPALVHGDLPQFEAQANCRNGPQAIKRLRAKQIQRCAVGPLK